MYHGIVFTYTGCHEMDRRKNEADNPSQRQKKFTVWIACGGERRMNYINILFQKLIRSLKFFFLLLLSFARSLLLLFTLKANLLSAKRALLKKKVYFLLLALSVMFQITVKILLNGMVEESVELHKENSQSVHLRVIFFLQSVARHWESCHSLKKNCFKD